MTPETADTETESTDDVNLSRLREMALRGSRYRETIEFEYAGLEGDLYVGPIPDEEFLPIAAVIEEKLDVDVEADDFEEQAEGATDEAKKKLDEARDDGALDASALDKEFVKTMQEVAVKGIDATQGIAEDETEEGLREIMGMLHGGKSLVIAEKVLELSSDAEKAEAFRRDGGSK